MDNMIIRFYNQNRFIFWTIVVMIIIAISLLHVLNRTAESKSKQNTSDTNITTNKKLDENYSVISGKQLNTVTTALISEFIDYCNAGDIEKAYELLSDDCKELLYPDLQTFKDSYANKIFDTKKLYACQAMITDDDYHTYQINFTKDMLAQR